mgnify:CR=1 FL=1
MDKVVFHFVLEFSEIKTTIEWGVNKTFTVFSGETKIETFTNDTVENISDAERVATEHFEEMENDFNLEKSIDHADIMRKEY